MDVRSDLTTHRPSRAFVPCRSARVYSHSLTNPHGLDGGAALTLNELNGKSAEKVSRNSAYNPSNGQNRSDIGHRVGRNRSAGNRQIENKAGLHAAVRKVHLRIWI